MKLEVFPTDSVLMGDPIKINVTEVSAEDIVTLHVRRKYYDGDVGYAYANYVTNQGYIDTSIHKPISGSYEGVDISGLFWSQISTEFEESLMPEILYDLGEEYNGHFVIDVELHNLIIDSCSLKLIDMLDDVKCTEVNEGKVRGKLYYKESNIPQRVVIHVAGDSGILAIEVNAKLLASKGIATLALPFYEYFDLPRRFKEIPLEYFKEAIDIISKFDFIDENRIGIMGSTRGAELALLVASYYNEIKLVIASNPSYVVNQSIDNQLFVSKSSWSINGKGLPHSKISKKSLSQNYIEKSFMQKRNIHGSSIYRHNPLDVEDSIILVEKMNGPILLLAGEDDCRWDSKFMSEMIVSRLKNTKFKDYYEISTFKDAGQVLGGPGFLPTVCFEKLTFSLGGTPQGNGQAQYKSWLEIIKFIKERL